MPAPVTTPPRSPSDCPSHKESLAGGGAPGRGRQLQRPVTAQCHCGWREYPLGSLRRWGRTPSLTAHPRAEDAEPQLPPGGPRALTPQHGGRPQVGMLGSKVSQLCSTPNHPCCSRSARQCSGHRCHLRCRVPTASSMSPEAHLPEEPLQAQQGGPPDGRETRPPRVSRGLELAARETGLPHPFAHEGEACPVPLSQALGAGGPGPHPGLPAPCSGHTHPPHPALKAGRRPWPPASADLACPRRRCSGPAGLAVLFHRQNHHPPCCSSPKSRTRPGLSSFLGPPPPPTGASATPLSHMQPESACVPPRPPWGAHGQAPRA